MWAFKVTKSAGIRLRAGSLPLNTINFAFPLFFNEKLPCNAGAANYTSSEKSFLPQTGNLITYIKV